MGENGRLKKIKAPNDCFSGLMIETACILITRIFILNY